MDQRLLLAICSPASDLNSGESDIARVFSDWTDSRIGGCHPSKSKQIKCDHENVFYEILSSFLSQWDPNDQLIFYYTGHGVSIDKEYYFQFEKNGEKTLLSDTIFFNKLKSKKVKKAIIIIDSCYSGNINPGGKGEILPEKIDFSTTTLPDGMAILVSSSPIQISHEFIDGSGSIFTNIIIEAIKTGLDGQKTPDGFIYLSDLINYLDKELKKEKYINYNQLPQHSIFGAPKNIWIAKNITGSIRQNTANADDLALDEDILPVGKSELPCESANSEMLDYSLIKEYFHKQPAVSESISWDSNNTEKALKYLNLFFPTKIRGEFKLKMSAVLCFHKAPQLYYPFLTSKFAILSDTLETRKTIEIEGNIPTQIEKCNHLIKEYTNFNAFYDTNGDFIKEVFTEQDYYTIREIISNAFAHRDYNIGLPISIYIFPEKIIIKNPGLFPNNYKWSYFLSQKDPASTSRNTFITQYLYSLYKYEGIGQGFEQVRKYLKRNGENSIICKEELSGPYTIIEITNPKLQSYIKIQDRNIIQSHMAGGDIITGNKVIYNTYTLKESVEYKKIKSEIEQLRMRLERMQNRIEKYPNDEGLKEELSEIQNEWDSKQKDLETLKQEVLKLARDFQRIPINTERLRLAKQYFEKGELDKARAILDDVAISDELDKLFQLNNILDNSGENLRNISDEYLILARLTATDFNLTDRYDRTLKYFNQSLRAERNKENLFAFAYFMQEHNQFEQAQLLYEEALQIIKKLPDANPQIYLLDVANTLNNLANIYKGKNEFNLAEPLYEEALDTIKKLVEENPQTYLPDLARTLNNLANLYQARSEFSRAQTLYEEALDTIKKLVKENPQTYLPDLARTLNNLANLYQTKNEFSRAQLLYEEALQTIKKLPDANPQTYLPDLATTLNNLANIYKEINEFSQAEPLYEEALGAIKKLAKVNTQIYLPDLSRTLNNLANLYQAKNEFGRAQPLYEESLGIIRKLAEENPQIYLPDLANTLNNLANLFQARNEFSQAQSLYEEALLVYRKLVSVNQEKVYLPFLATILNNLGNLYQAKNEYNLAYQMFSESLEIHVHLTNLDREVYLPKQASSLNNLANIQYLTHNFEDALPLYRKSIDIYEKLSNDNPQSYLFDYVSVLTIYTTILNEQKLYTESLDTNIKSLELHKSQVEQQSPTRLIVIGDILTNIANTYSNIGEFNNAEDGYKEAIKYYEKFHKTSTDYLEKIPLSYLNISIFYQKHRPNKILSIEYAEKNIKYINSHFMGNSIPQKKYLKDAFDILKYWNHDLSHIFEGIKGKYTLSEIGIGENWHSPKTVLILTSLPIENDAVSKYLTGERKSVILGSTAYEQGYFIGKHHQYKVVVREAGMKNLDMALATELAIQHFQPQIVLLIGIAAGIKDIRIGDVLVANKTYGYESGKDNIGGFKARPNVESYSRELLGIAQILSRGETWKTRCSDGAKDAKVYLGSIASGDKVLMSISNENFQRIEKYYNDSIGIDMESIGFATAIQPHRNLHGLAIRGIADLCYSKYETVNQNWQVMAAERSSAFGFELLYELNVTTFIPDNLGVMDLKTLAKEIYSLLFPAGLKEINHDFADAVNGDIREVWRRVKPLFIEEVVELSKSPDDVDAQADVRSKLRKELEGRLNLQEELTTLVKEAKAKNYYSVSSTSVMNSKNIIVSGSINVGGDFRLGDG